MITCERCGIESDAPVPPTNWMWMMVVVAGVEPNAGYVLCPPCGLKVHSAMLDRIDDDIDADEQAAAWEQIQAAINHDGPLVEMDLDSLP